MHWDRRALHVVSYTLQVKLGKREKKSEKSLLHRTQQMWKTCTMMSIGGIILIWDSIDFWQGLFYDSWYLRCHFTSMTHFFWVLKVFTVGEDLVKNHSKTPNIWHVGELWLNDWLWCIPATGDKHFLKDITTLKIKMAVNSTVDCCIWNGTLLLCELPDIKGGLVMQPLKMLGLVSWLQIVLQYESCRQTLCPVYLAFYEAWYVLNNSYYISTESRSSMFGGTIQDWYCCSVDCMIFTRKLDFLLGVSRDSTLCQREWSWSVQNQLFWQASP